MHDSGFKEKKDNSGIFKNPLNFVRNLYGRKSEKGPNAEIGRAPHMTQEQKEKLLRNKYPSDEDPLDPTLRRQTTHASTSSTGTESHNFPGKTQEPKFIKLSSGVVVDNVHNRMEHQQQPFHDHSPSPPRGPPPASFWSSPSSEGYGYRGGYGGGGTTKEFGSSFGSSRQDQRRGELDHEEASYETLLKEASMLREDLESERNRHRGTKEEFENKMTQTKQRIATAKTQQRLDPPYYNDIILLLSQELTELEKKVKDMEARITPLDNTIDDIKGVERFIKDRELDSQQASMLFENIMKKMFDDLSVSGHVLTGEATHNFGMPRNVLDELQDKMLKSALKKSDPTRSGSAGDNQGLDWMEFDNEEERVTKISTSDSHEEALRKKRKELAREKFARVSRKLDQVVEFSEKRNKTQFQRAAAFRFNAVDRADAFKDVNYIAPSDFTIEEEDEESVISKSATSGVSTTEALQSLDESVWLGLNTTPVEPSPAPVKQQGIPNAASVGNVKDLEAFPETKVDLTVSGEGQDSKKEPPVLADSGLGPAAWTGAQPPPLPLPPGTETAGFKLNIDLDFGKGGGQGGSLGGPKVEQENSTEKTKPEGKKEETGSTADALNEVKQQKTEQTGSGTGATIDLDTSSKTGQGGSDVGNFGIKIKGETPPEEKPKTEVKTEIKVEEKSPPPKKTPPPPPPKPKGAPPPPPGKKKPPPKGGPPPPPGGRKKANDGLTRAPEVIAMFQEMRKALLGNAAKGGGGPKKIGGGGSADPGALMDELSKNSKYAAQVQADIENYGEIIQGLITQVSTFEPKDMPEMIEFVGTVDDVLSELSDETAVLKNFDWPQRYYTMLEAKGLYTELEKMKQTFSPWKKTENKAVAEMQKIQKFVDKSKTRVDVIMRTKDSDEKKFKENKIPWNAKLFTEVKIASLSPLITYMEVALNEVNNLMSAAPAEEGPMRKKALDKSLEHLNGTITFAFKVHQFTGGYTKECNSKFAEISKKITEIRGQIAAIG